jgi:hypothetical protein
MSEYEEGFVAGMMHGLMCAHYAPDECDADGDERGPGHMEVGPCERDDCPRKQ